MASLGHIAVGMAAARVYERGRVPRASSMAFWSVLSLLPDVDVIGFAFGVDYADPWGHRGATHSLTLAAALGVAVGLAARQVNLPAARATFVATAVLASHAVLDTMTDGGLGCALLWPFELARYFAPWRPIPVAPIGLGLLSPYGGMVALAELVLFAPVLLFALRSPPIVTRRVGVFLALWLAAVLSVLCSDTIRDAIIGSFLREDTHYSAGFSDAAFRTITPGQSESDVRHLLGPPSREVWFYTPPEPRAPHDRPAPSPHVCQVLRFEAGVVVAGHNIVACHARGVGTGQSTTEVEKRMGPPNESCWQYSWSPGGGRYRERLVCLSRAKVQMVIRKWST